MASHALAVMFLARCYAEPPRRELERVVETAVDEIARSQNDDGGWSYEPLKGDSAVPVTVCQVAALDAARRSGCQVPPELFDRAPGFLIRCQNPDGGFKNTLTDGASAYDRTAAAVAALQIASPPDSQALAAGLAFLNADLDLAVHAQSDSFFVDCLFVAWVLPRVDEQHRSAWYSALRSELMRRREDDGSWRDNLGRERATAIACMALLLPQTTSEGSTPSSDIPESTYRLVPQTYQAGKNNDTPPAIRPANLFHPNGTRRSGVLVR
jgi:prenyltransferase beta subunit